MIFSVSVASFALGAYQSSGGRRGAGRHRQRERAMAGGKYTWLHNKAKWRVLFLYPLTWISVSISSAPSPPLAGLASTHVSDIKLTVSPLAEHPQLRVNRHMFLRDTFSLRPQGNRGWGALFSSPTQNIHTGRLCKMCVRRITYVGLIGMLTYSRQPNHSWLSVGEASSRAWHEAGRQEKKLMTRRGCRASPGWGSVIIVLVYRECGLFQRWDGKTRRRP